MKRIITLMFLVFMFNFSFALEKTNAQEYVVVPAESSIEWFGKKVTGEHTGTINLKQGKMNLAKGIISGGEFEIDMASIVNLDLQDPEYKNKLMNHLKSDDFFSVTTFPVSRFVITDAKEVDNKENPHTNYKIKGDLTIKGITHSIEFPASVHLKDGKLIANADVTVNRAKYNVRYGSGSFFEGLGDKLIYDDFILKLNLVASK
ncbi:MAG: YceI family protein [Calditrichaceae bacterium]